MKAFSAQVWGHFDIVDGEGVSLLPSGDKARAVIATLCAAPAHKRSRTWLQAIFWADAPPQKAAANLRQAVRRLRRSDLHLKGLFHADDHTLWLDQRRLVIAPCRDPCACYLEGLDVGAEGFEEWLQEQRSQGHRAEPPPLAAAPSAAPLKDVLPKDAPFQDALLEDTPLEQFSNDRTRSLESQVAHRFESGPIPDPMTAYGHRISGLEDTPAPGVWGVPTDHSAAFCLAILPIVAGSAMDQIAGDTIMDVVAGTVVQQGCAEVLDLRSGPDACAPVNGPSPAIGVVLRVLRRQHEHCISILLKRLSDGWILWTGWYNALLDGDAERSMLRFQITASEIANAVYDRMVRYSHHHGSDGLFGAIHNVLSHSKTGQAAARAALCDQALDCGLARAWLIYTFAVAHAEQHGGLGAADREALEAHCVQAVAAAPDNPIVQAIVGHIYAFVFRQAARAEDHHAVARKLGWHHPLVWTLSAMHANYNCQSERAYQYSWRAMTQSEHSPYRFFFEGPHSISCTLTHRHGKAVALSRQILAKKPMFLAVMRHMAASQALSGDMEAARATVDLIRSRDGRFVGSELAGDDYPLPSANSVAIIGQALSLADTTSATVQH